MSRHTEHLVKANNVFYYEYSPSSDSNNNSTYAYRVLFNELKGSVLETAAGSQIPQHVVHSSVAREMDSR